MSDDKPKTAEEAVKSENTQAAIERFTRAVLDSIASGRFNIIELGTLYENMGKDFPLVGQYIELRDYLFAAADKAGYGYALRLVYHAGETGARVTAALTAQGLALAASNYGAASPTTLMIAQQLGALAGPIGVGVGVVSAILTGLFGGESQEEHRERLIEAREAARKYLKNISALPKEARDVLMQLEYVKSLETMANLRIDDPLGYIQDPGIREQLREGIYQATGKRLDDPAILSAAKSINLKIAPRDKGVTVESYAIWTGPVSASHVAGATVQGAIVKVIGCTGDGKPSCSDIAEGWTDAAGRKLPGMLRKLKIPEGVSHDLYLGAFSAGGHIIKRVLMNDTDRAAIKAVLLSDATYVAEWKNEKAGEAGIIEGFARYGVDAIKDGRVFLATASTAANKTWPNGAQTLAALRQEIESRAGVVFADITDQASSLFPGLRAPVSIHRASNVVFANFGLAYKHNEHATVIARVAWTSGLAYITGGASSPASPAPPGVAPGEPEAPGVVPASPGEPEAPGVAPGRRATMTPGNDDAGSIVRPVLFGIAGVVLVGAGVYSIVRKDDNS